MATTEVTATAARVDALLELGSVRDQAERLVAAVEAWTAQTAVLRAYGFELHGLDYAALSWNEGGDEIVKLVKQTATRVAELVEPLDTAEVDDALEQLTDAVVSSMWRERDRDDG